MSGLLRLPLTYILLILIGGFALLISVLSYLSTRPLILSYIERQAEARLTANLTELQGVLELLLRLDQTAGARRVVASLGAAPGLEAMRLVNADGTVIASTSVAEIDKSLTATPQPLDRTARARVAETGGVEVMLAPDRRRLIGKP